MSQMLVRIDEETDKALTYLYDNNGIMSLNEFAVKTYEMSFKRLLAKKPEVEINVYFSGRTSAKGNPINNAEFTDSRVRLKRQEQKVAEVVGGEVIPQADDLDMPF